MPRGVTTLISSHGLSHCEALNGKLMLRLFLPFAVRDRKNGRELNINEHSTFVNQETVVREVPFDHLLFGVVSRGGKQFVDKILK